MNLPQCNFSKQILTLCFAISTPMILTACGGGSTSDKIKDEYDRLEDQISQLSDDIKDDYRELEGKFSDEERSMATILESVFLPEKTEENLKQFLDKITPKDGKGGLYVGHFVESSDSDNSDIDIGAIYFDISKADFVGSIDGRVSYQQQACQLNRTLATDSAVKVDNVMTGKFSGSLDSLKFFDIKYVRDLGIETPNILTTFSGKFNNDNKQPMWYGDFEYQDGLGGTKLSSGEKGCNVSYTLASRSSFKTYPLDFKLGNLDIKRTGTGSVTSINWSNPNNASVILVSQINVNQAKSGANGFARNQIFINGESQYTPVVTDMSTNYAFVVQAFDANHELIAYDAMVLDLPDAR